MPTNNLSFENYFSTTLSSAITATDTTIYLNALPASNEGYLVIEPDSATNREIIYYTSKGSNFVTCPSVATGRGVGGTTAVGHGSGSTVQMNTVAEMFKGIQDGTGNTGMHQYFDESFADYVRTGGNITQATGLIASVSGGTTYINGRRLNFNPFSRTLTASRDTYIDLYETSGSNIATVSYTELSSGATGSTPVSNGIHLGMVRTNASTIATITQTGSDILGNQFRPDAIISPSQIANGAVTNAKLNVRSTVDANGWTVIDFGTLKIYHKRLTFSQTVATTPTFITLPSSNLPVGFTNIGSANFMQYTWTAAGYASRLLVSFEGSTSDTSLIIVGISSDTSRSYTGWIDFTFWKVS